MPKHPGLPPKKTVDEVLAAINTIRSDWGLPPVRSILRGEKGHGRHCPVARTLGVGQHQKACVYVNYPVIKVWVRDPLTGLRVLGSNKVVATPPVLERFIADFDCGMYPGLEMRWQDT